MDFDNYDQFKYFIKSEANRLGISVQNTYNTYFARVILETINKWSNNEVFVKGSFSEYGHVGKLVRPITDVDLVSLEGTDKTLNTIFSALYKNNKPNSINFELSKVPYQTNTGIYKIPIEVHYGKLNHTINIDFQEKSNTIYKTSYRSIKPIFTGDYYFGVWMPTIEEYIAEKLCIVLENNKSDVLNTRVKDFYDIWKLLECNYNANEVEYFFGKMIVDRKKANIDNLDPSFLNAEYVERHQQIWDDISKKYEFLDKNVVFSNAVRCTKSMLNHEIEHFQRVRKR